MTLRKTVHAESFLVQSKDTLETVRNYQQNSAELSLCQKQNKSNFCTRLCSGVSYLTHPKLCPTSKNCLRNTKRPQNTARKQEWREPFYSEQTLGTNTLTNSALGHKFDTNRTKIRIWMKNFTIEKHTGLMQISGQKNRYRGLFRLCKNPRQAKQILSNRQRFFIFFPVKQEELKKSRTNEGLIGNSSEDLPSEDNSRTLSDMENREHQIIAEQHSRLSQQTTRTSWDHQQRYYPLF